MGIRTLSLAWALGLLAGCAAVPTLPVCAAETTSYAAPDRAGGVTAQPTCAPASARPAAQLAAAQQTHGQTRTVGVPRSFLIVMIVLLVLMLA